MTSQNTDISSWDTLYMQHSTTSVTAGTTCCSAIRKCNFAHILGICWMNVKKKDTHFVHHTIYTDAVTKTVVTAWL